MAEHADVMGVLLQANLDGELDPAEAAELARHLADCEECRVLASRLGALKGALRHEALRYGSPPALRDAVRRIGHAGAKPRRWRWRPMAPLFGAFLAGAAIAAVLVALVVPRSLPETTRVAQQIATATERSRQPGHMLDVESAAPIALAKWLGARMGFTPVVRTPTGFALTGGRLDYLHHRPVAVLVYAQGAGTVELYAWPEQHAPTPPRSVATAGLELAYWREGGMEYWAAGRSSALVMAFARAWRESG